jgi:hypothetical protein
VRILLGTRDLGRPIAVDEHSLESPLDPVKVLIGCRAPVHLPPFTVLFFNSQGFKVHIAREDGEREENSDPPLPQRKLSEDREEDLEESDGEGWDRRRGKRAKKDKGSTKGVGFDLGAQAQICSHLGIGRDARG